MWSSLFSNGGVTISRIWSQAAGVIMMLTAAKLLTPTEFGVFALASASTMILNQLVGVGPYEYVVRERERPEVADTAFWFNMAFAAGVTVIGLAVAFWATQAFPGNRLPYMIAFLVPLTLPAGWRSVIEGVLVREARLAALAGATIAVETIAFVAGMTALIAGAGVKALILHKVVYFVAAVPVFSVIGRWRPHFKGEMATAKKMASFGAGIFGDRVLGYLQAYGVDLILGVLFNPAAVAFYRIGARIVIAVAAVVGEQFRTLAWVRLTRARTAGEPVHIEAERVIGAAFILTTGAFVGLALVSDLLIAAFLGPDWAISGQVVAFLSIAILVSTPNMFSDAIFGTLGATRWLMANRAIIVSVLMLCFFAAAGRGPVWTAAGQLVASLIGAAIVVTVQRKVGGVRAKAYLPTLLRCAGAAFFMGVIVLIVKAGLSFFGVTSVVALVVTVATGLLCYSVACWVLFGRRLLEIVSSLLVRGN